MSAPAISVVVPCYNEEACLPELHRRVSAAACAAAGDAYEIVLINDGSRDGSWGAMQDLARNDERLVAINLSRNHGHQLAMTAGLRSEEQTSELQSLMRISYAVFCLKKKKSRAKK